MRWNVSRCGRFNDRDGTLGIHDGMDAKKEVSEKETESKYPQSEHRNILKVNTITGGGGGDFEQLAKSPLFMLIVTSLGHFLSSKYSHVPSFNAVAVK